MALPARKDAGTMSREHGPAESGPLRRCIACGEALPKDKLLRFVVGPDGAVVPDLAGTLPGRGLWVRASRDMLETAQKRKAFARAARQHVTVAPDLADEVARQLRARALNILGLARRAGVVVAGYEKVREAAGDDRNLVQIRALGRGGASAGVSAASGPADLTALFTSEELSQALGRENVVHVALRKSPIAQRFEDACERLVAFAYPPTSPVTDSAPDSTGGLD